MANLKSIKNWKRKILISIVLSVALDLMLIVLLRHIRAFFPYPEIFSIKIVGYAQYFGYPLYFDTIYIFLLILMPSAMLLLCNFLGNRLNGKN
jgi:hypothetical protein